VRGFWLDCIMDQRFTPRRRTVLIGMAAAGLGGTSQGAQAMASETVADRAHALMAHAFIARPPGPGPFPVVLQMHGCGGCKPFQRHYAEAVVQAGGAAVVVDSFAHREIGTWEAYATVCTGARLRGAQRAGDLFAVYDWVRAQPWVDPARVIAAGWSHGAWTVMDALALPSDHFASATGLQGLAQEPLAGLAGVFLVYPYCGIASLSSRNGWRFAPRGVAIVAGRDRVVGARQPLAVLNGLVADGAPLTVLTFPEATHAFDERESSDFRVRYSEERTREATNALIGLIRG
jgi:dienelactone hydrolase